MKIVIDETKKQAEIVAKQVQEAKAYLVATDHKFIPGYVPRESEDLDAILAERNKQREFIRENE